MDRQTDKDRDKRYRDMHFSFGSWWCIWLGFPFYMWCVSSTKQAGGLTAVSAIWRVYGVHFFSWGNFCCATSSHRFCVRSTKYLSVTAISIDYYFTLVPNCWSKCQWLIAVLKINFFYRSWLSRFITIQVSQHLRQGLLHIVLVYVQ